MEPVGGHRGTPGWIPLLAATYAIGVSNSVVFAALSDLQDKYRFSDAGLGWIAGAGFVVGFFAQLLISPFADRGHSKRLLMIGLLLAVGGGALFAAGSSLVVFVIARAVLGCSNGTFLPAARAIVASMSPDGVAERLGRLGGVELAGFVTGPVIGGALIGPLGIRWPFLVCSSAALIALIALAGRRLHEPPRAARHERIGLELLRLPRMRLGLLLSAGLFLPVGVYDALWDRYLTDRGASNTVIGLSFLLYGVPFVMLAAAGGRTADRIGPTRAAIIAIACAAPFTGSYGLITLPWLIVAASVAEGSIQALAVPGAQATIAAAAPPGRASAAQGLAGSTQLLAAAVAAMASPAIYGAMGPGPVFLFAGGLMLVCAAAATIVARQLRRSTIIAIP